MGDIVLLRQNNGIQKIMDYKELLNQICDANGTIFSPEKVASIIRKNYDKGYGFFPIIEFAQEIGLDVIAGNFRSVDKNVDLKGYLVLMPDQNDNEKGRHRIVVSEQESYGHQRWTTAHELWHYFKNVKTPRTTKQFYTELPSNYGEDAAPEEKEANTFANELLMPRVDFSSAYRNSGIWGRNGDIADIFMVSETAVKKRAKDLCL